VKLRCSGCGHVHDYQEGYALDAAYTRPVVSGPAPAPSAGTPPVVKVLRSEPAAYRWLVRLAKIWLGSGIVCGVGAGIWFLLATLIIIIDIAAPATAEAAHHDAVYYLWNWTMLLSCIASDILWLMIGTAALVLVDMARNIRK
jgi:hypothetical protein